MDKYDLGLERGPANYVPLTPLSFLKRTVKTHPDRVSVVYGDRSFTWRETDQRCRRLAAGLRHLGIVRNDTVAVLAPNVPAMFEAHLGVPMAGAVLNALNIRLDAATIARQLEHGEARIILVDAEFLPLLRAAFALMSVPPGLVVITDEDRYVDLEGAMTYERLLSEASPAIDLPALADEWDAIALNYTSGTTGSPKGVVYHHRGAYLNSVGNALVWSMPQHPVYLWTLPMFHCNGWCFPWTVTVQAGTHVCLRQADRASIEAALAVNKITHMCGAPIILQTLLDIYADSAVPRPPIKIMAAGAPPPVTLFEKAETLGIEVIHAYGLTEVYGPVVSCAPQEIWRDMSSLDRATHMARQGVEYPVMESICVRDPETFAPVPDDGQTIGEVALRGNVVMKGYLKAPELTADAFRSGWFSTGDLGVMHGDGYVEIKDRAKDIVISGGENIASIEVEAILYRFPGVRAAAIVAMPDVKWGETPCAFLELEPGQEIYQEDIVAFCRKHLAHFKVPKHYIVGDLPRTSTGKVQKYLLRERAKQFSRDLGNIVN